MAEWYRWLRFFGALGAAVGWFTAHYFTSPPTPNLYELAGIVLGGLAAYNIYSYFWPWPGPD